MKVNQLARDNPHIAELLVSGTSADIAACSWCVLTVAAEMLRFGLRRRFAISWYPIVCGSQANMRPIMVRATPLSSSVTELLCRARFSVTMR